MRKNECARRYREANREALAAKATVYRTVNKEEIARRRRERYANDADARQRKVEDALDRGRAGTQYLQDLKSSGCVVCRRTDGRLCFHHVDPRTKLFNPSTARAHCREKLNIELAKCVVLCAACHNKVHAGTAKIPQNIVDKINSRATIVAHQPQLY